MQRRKLRERAARRSFAPYVFSVVFFSERFWVQCDNRQNFRTKLGEIGHDDLCHSRLSRSDEGMGGSRTKTEIP